MKQLILSLLFLSSVVMAEEVTVTGFGTTYNSALESAKVSALEKGASTFLIGENSARNGKVTEEIDQYNGGILQKYQVVSHQQTPNGHEVTIVADVVPKNNTVRRKSRTDLNIDFEEYEQREKVVARLDNISKAIHAKVTNVQPSIGRYETTVRGSVLLSWQPKWITDMKSFGKVMNDNGKTTNNIYDNASGSLVNALMTRAGFVGAMVGMGVDAAARPETPMNSNSMMYCFSQFYNSSFDCTNAGVDITFPRNPKLVIVAKSNGRDIVLYEQYLDMKMYRYVSAGESMGTTGLLRTNYQTRFHNPAFIIHEQETQTVDLTFNVENSIIKSVTELYVYVR